MDVDALTQKGGKGKDGKGRKYGGQEGRKYGSREGNRGKEKFAGECWICGKAGHKSSECGYKDKKGQDGGKGGKKGKAKGKEKRHKPSSSAGGSC
eukprot:3172131-Amphidinium_carterae.1